MTRSAAWEAWSRSRSARAGEAKKYVLRAWPGDLGERVIDQLGGDDMDPGSEFLFILGQIIYAGTQDPVEMLRTVNVQACLNLRRDLDRWLARGLGCQIRSNMEEQT
jgi:hypothetical protein